jgi:hypothetical protein
MWDEGKIVRFLIDDVAFIEDDCSRILDDIAADAPIVLLSTDDE